MKVDRYKKSLDELETDVIVTTLFEDERPPRQVSGFIDWRLHGFLSRAVRRGELSGALNETVLLPLSDKLPARRAVVVGLGKPKDFTLSRAREVSAKLVQMINNLQAVDVSVVFPSANDERVEGDTARVMLSVFENSRLPADLLVRWIDAKTYAT